jgi:DNA-binding response OmpR family regulator
VPIIVLTAKAATSYEKIFRERSFDGFISKPIDLRQLDAALNTKETLSAVAGLVLTSKFDTAAGKIDCLIKEYL